MFVGLGSGFMSFKRFGFGFACLSTLGAGLLVVCFWNCLFPFQFPNNQKTVIQSKEDKDWFLEKANSVGVTLAHDCGPWSGDYFMPQILGSGVAIFDADGDGRSDLFFPQCGGPKGKPNQLYLQKEPDRFELAPPGNGLDYSAYCSGVAVGDVNRDGKPDLLVSEFSGIRLFLNDGGGKFHPGKSPQKKQNPDWGMSCAIADLDGDGLPELVVANYVGFDPEWPCTGPSGQREFCPPSAFPGKVTRIFKNLGSKIGNDPEFEDVTLSSGLAGLAGPGLGLVIADFGGRAIPDILVANDGKPNHLWMNQGGMTFKEEALARGIAYEGSGRAQAGMGVALGDFTGRGRVDVFITHLAAENHGLWFQGEEGRFRERGARAGIMRSLWRGTGFGTVALDFNFDGQLDLVLANGSIAAETALSGVNFSPEGWHHAYQQRNQIFRGGLAGGEMKFTDLSNEFPSFCGSPGIHRGLASGDLNGDGKPDLVVTRVGKSPQLFYNQNPGKGIAVAFQDKYAMPLNGPVRVELGDGRTRILPCGGSYLSASDSILFFGQESDLLPWGGEITVIWPGGEREKFLVHQEKVKQIIRMGKGLVAPAAKKSGSKS